MSEPPSTFTDAQRLDSLRLIRSENVGPVTYHRLLERYGSAKAALEALPELARQGGRSSKIKVCSKSAAEKEMGEVVAAGAVLVCAGEDHFPPLLAAHRRCTTHLFVKGHTHLLKKKSFGIVGARNATINGKRFAASMARDLGKAGFLVVSGMARGIDTAAHEGALATGTLAVLGGGVDVVYPQETKVCMKRFVTPVRLFPK